MQSNNPRVLKWILIIAIVIVTNLFIGYALSIIYKEPQYENFCKESQVNETISTKAMCLEVGGQWNESASVPQVAPDGVTKPVPQVTAYCNPTYTCQNNYYDAQKVYDRNVFITLVIIGVLLVSLGFFFKTNEVLSYGFSLAGVLSFLIASVRYWSAADDLIKVIILAAALAVLIYLAYKRFSVHSLPKTETRI